MARVLTIISMEGTDDLNILNRDYKDNQEELRKDLRLFGSEQWVKETLSSGIFLSKSIVVKFKYEGKIVRLCKDGTDWYESYCKGERVIIHPDARVGEKIPSLREELQRTFFGWNKPDLLNCNLYNR